jgi:hypothetical protein
MTTIYGLAAMITAGSDGLDDVARGVLRSSAQYPSRSLSIAPRKVGVSRTHNLPILR